MTPAFVEEIVPIASGGQRLWGVLTRPQAAQTANDIAVLIVVGGPQYRAGSHRMFVQLARAFATAGHPTLRFDVQGMGDSGGERIDFTAIAADLRAAMQALRTACAPLQRIAVWGLCDGASAALMFATRDTGVAGIVAVNPWARSSATLAATHVKHYYLRRLLDREFWVKLLRGRLRVGASLRELAGTVATARTAGRGDAPGGAFQTMMADGLRGFRGELLLVLSGNDLTAREFIEYAATSPAWQGLLQRGSVQRLEQADADHTFSHRPWLDALAADTVAWLGRIPSATADSLTASEV